MSGRLGIIGATGWLGQALGLHLLNRGLWPAADLVLLNRSGPQPAYDAHPGVIWARDAGEMLELCETVVLSVRPEDFPVPGFVPGRHLLLSFMAGWTMQSLRSLAPEARIVRAMPNGGASVGQSWTPWVAGAVAEADLALVRRRLSAFGTEAQVATEDQLDILSAISGSGAAYPLMLAEALMAAARDFGLPPAIAEAAIEAVVCGSAPLIAGRIPESGAILDAYKSYRGITAAGIGAAEAGGFDASVRAAIAAAVAKARAMGR